MTSIYDWSVDAAVNANADMLINWAEGQAPSTVNDSARAMMQRIAEYLADRGGVVVAAGSANALDLVSNVPVSALKDGIMLRFRGSFANSGSATMNVNNLGSQPIFKATYTGVTSLTGGEIQADGIYDSIYVQALAGGMGGWLLLDPTPPQFIPAGLIASFAHDAPPQGWLECDGAQISRTIYANLFAAIGTKWGAGDGSTSFHLPDLRGQFLRGWDHGRGLDAGRVFASRQESQNKNHNHGGFTSINGNHTHNYSVVDFGSVSVAAGGISVATGKVEEGRITQAAGAHQHQIASDGGAEARPHNIAVLYAIKI